MSAPGGGAEPIARCKPAPPYARTRDISRSFCKTLFHCHPEQNLRSLNILVDCSAIDYPSENDSILTPLWKRGVRGDLI